MVARRRGRHDDSDGENGVEVDGGTTTVVAMMMMMMMKNNNDHPKKIPGDDRERRNGP